MKAVNQIVIVGNGISGVTCARHIRKVDPHVKIIIVSGETDYFFSRTALMYIYMGHMKYEHTKPYADDFWSKNRIELKSGWVTQVNFDHKSLTFENGEELSYDRLVLATGSKPNKFGWPGQDLLGVQGLYSMQDLNSMEKRTSAITRAVIVGGGLIGVEMAEMFATRKIPVTFLVREKSFWSNVLPPEEAQLVARHIREHHIDLRLSTELSEILDDGNGEVKEIKTSTGEIIRCEFVGLTAGVSPNIDFLKNSGLETNRGIVVNKKFQTNISEVYAIGDCVEFKEAPGPDRKNIEQVWYTGRMHGETLAYNLTHDIQVDYKPGIWFNSAKFFDIEYQTYGFLPTSWGEDKWSFYWEEKQGKIAIRLLFDAEDRILAINVFGWRMRHEFFDTAIKEGWSSDRVMKNLGEASFNPEFYKDYHMEVVNKYNQEKGRNVQLSKRSIFHKLFGYNS
ncbi:FAD/NAD(P)-binding oxidoreductase [uncultured Cyclobacterium sp.]|uniref:NAD(P)/FAD-dependent oxidoreductase n=1 Tax=uncultured Cyclobacterium sp. TaxID=453820 RepID=UPI0030EC3377|tara:strand:- start:118211 stop:119563 length:1353 start_codon:yes stop_codon:yes gene_type:complete